MRARKIALAGFLMVVVPVALGQEFKPHASQEGRYRVLFPGEVKTETTDIKAGKDGKERLKHTLDIVELKAGTYFLVSYVDSTDEIAKTPAGTRLNKVRDGNKGEAGKLIAEKDIQVGVDRYPGRDILLETPDGYIRNRAVIAGKRLYQVMVQGTKDVVTSPSADKFIGSFEITK
jgi:hypothetical protein